MVEYRELTRREITRSLAFIGVSILVWSGALAVAIVLLKDQVVAMVVVLVLLTALLLGLLLRWHATSFAYRCPECDHIFTLSIAQDFISPNLGTHKLVRCPKCNDRFQAMALKIVRD